MIYIIRDNGSFISIFSFPSHAEEFVRDFYGTFKTLEIPFFAEMMYICERLKLVKRISFLFMTKCHLIEGEMKVASLRCSFEFNFMAFQDLQIRNGATVWQ